MRTNRFCPLRVRVPDQLEEILLRIVLARFESPIPVLAYLVSLCRRLNPGAIPPDWLDLTLSRLADIVREILAEQKPLSANSATAYLDDLRYQLDRSPTRVPPGANPFRESGCRPGVHWGNTTLRAYLSHDIEGSYKASVLLAARRIGRVRLRWSSREVFAVFAAARYKDVLIYFQGRYGLDKSLAVELAQETFVRIQQRLSKFDPARGRLIAFTFNEVRLVVRDYRKRARRRHARESSLEEMNEASDAVERSLAESVQPETDPDREAMKLRFTEQLFSLDKPPHQILVFIVCRLLGVPPLKILEKYSRLPLRKVARIAEREYLRVTSAPSDVVRAGFKTLRARMNRRLAKLVRGEKHLAALGPLAAERAGGIPLGQYFPGENFRAQAREIVKAWTSVRKALAIGGGSEPSSTSSV